MPRKKPPAADALTAAPPAAWAHIDTLTPWDNNPRNNDKAVPSVVRSILRFGFPTALTVDDASGLLVAGHTRTRALRVILKGGMKVVLDDGTTLRANPRFRLAGSPGPGFVPVRRHAFASPAEAHAYALADNRLSELAEWDDAMLAQVVTDILSQPDMGPVMHDAGFADDDPVMASVIAEMTRDDAPPVHDPSVPTGTHTGTAGGPDGTASPDQSKNLHTGFNVIIECRDEAHQREVLDLCIGREWTCRALL